MVSELRELAPYIILAVYGILHGGPLCVDTFRIPRDLFMGLSSVGLLVCDAVWGASFFISPSSLVLLGVLAGWWMLCAIQAQRVSNAITNTVPLIATLIVALHIQYSLVGFALLVASGTLTAIYGIFQTRGIDIFARGSLPQQCIGSHGNVIQHGGYLLLCLGLSLLLATTIHWAWAGATLIMLVALWLTKSRGAFFGAVMGGLVLAVGLQSWLWLVVFAVILILGSIVIRALRPELFNATTISERRHYWHVAVLQILHDPVFGLGADQFGTRVPFIQRDLNQQTNGQFLLPSNYQAPWPTRAHSDIIQWAVEWGVIGALLMLLVIERAIIHAPNVYVLAGLVAFLAAGLTFHFHTLRTTNGLFWALLIVCMGTPVATTPSVPVLVALAITMFVLVFRFTLRELCYDMTYHEYLRHLRTKAPPINPLNWKPDSSAARMEACLFWARQGDGWQVIHHAHHIIATFDGTQRIWETWNILGVGYMMGRHFDFAEKCFETALTLLPSYVPSRQNLQNVKNLKAGVIQ